MKIKTESKTVIEVTGHFGDNDLYIPRERLYDGEAEEYDIISFNGLIKESDLPQGEYKVTITLEKI